MICYIHCYFISSIYLLFCTIPVYIALILLAPHWYTYSRNTSGAFYIFYYNVKCSLIFLIILNFSPHTWLSYIEKSASKSSYTSIQQICINIHFIFPWCLMFCYIYFCRPLLPLFRSTIPY